MLAPWPAGRPPEPLIERGRAALSERGEGFKVGASAGFAALPGDAADADEALRVADRRLYADKNSGRVSARLQSAGVLRSALSEWDPELGGHADDVVEIAVQVARHLGLDEDEIERVAIAAELHDIGKIAIPRSILAKPGPLDADEWTFMRRHTLIGERIVQSAPALVGIAGLIRSCHERWDGAGYPDQLAARRDPARRPDRLRLRRLRGDDQRPLLPGRDVAGRGTRRVAAPRGHPVRARRGRSVPRHARGTQRHRRVDECPELDSNQRPTP